jgi:hypothetical protein
MRAIQFLQLRCPEAPKAEWRFQKGNATLHSRSRRIVQLKNLARIESSKTVLTLSCAYHDPSKSTQSAHLAGMGQ